MKYLNIAFIILFYNFSFSQIPSEIEINDLARRMSKNLTGTKIMNSDITIERVYSLERDIVTVYNLPENIDLIGDSVKNERISQLKEFGGNYFYLNKINLELWFMKSNKIYLRVRINYFEIKQN
jgi:hypothetical protein